MVAPDDQDIAALSRLVAQLRTDLAESRLLLSLTEATARLGYWRLDARTLQVQWSPQVFAIHGLPYQEEPDLKAAIDAYHRCDRDMVQQAVQQALVDGQPYSLQARLVRGNGEIVHVRSDGQPILDADGNISGVFGTFQDITDMVTVRETLQAARMEAEAANAAKSNFLAMMSHEVRTPVSGMLSAIELLRNRADLAEHERLFSSLDRSAKTLMRLLNDVLDYSGLELGKLAIEPGAFDLARLIEETLALFEPLAQAKGIALGWGSSALPHGQVIGDQQRIQQILGNIIGNAIRFTEKGSVIVDCHPASGRTDMWEIRVKDTGIGMASSLSAQLFAPFIQADEATRRRYGGTGLGLAISQRLAQAMGGLITVQSNEGTGSLFCISLPLAPDENGGRGALPDDKLAADMAVAGSLNVLVAEDQEINLLLMRELLALAGHRILGAGDGQAAINQVSAGGIDVVVMDMHMPLLTGKEAVQAIRSLPGAAGQVPIIALTADVLTDWSKTLAGLEVFAVLHKPIDYAELRRMIGLAHRSAQAKMGEQSGAESGHLIRPDRIAEMADLLGHAAVLRLLAMLSDDLAQRPAQIVALIRSGDDAGAASQSHALIGALRNLGAEALTAVLEPVAKGSNDPAVCEAILSMSARTAAKVAALQANLQRQ